MMSSRFEHLAKSLSGTYRLKSTLGSGGASHVFVADELKTGRTVAIKVLREELAASVSAQRFLREISIAAQLEHPNIVPVCGSGTVDGLPYYVMPFLEGHSLRIRLNRVGRLPLDEVLDICEEVGAALDYAHRRRVIHRDIKPENVLLHAGHALVLDFGIALALDAAEYSRHTLPGSVPGTPEYMSPEQAQGDVPIDGRSDVYSLACMAYEMISGNPPFSGGPSLVYMRHISAEPLPLCCRMPNVPHGLSAAVARALSKEPAHRFATPGAFVAAMRAGSDGPHVRRATTSGIIRSAAERPVYTVPERRQTASCVSADRGERSSSNGERQLTTSLGLSVAIMALLSASERLPHSVGRALALVSLIAVVGSLLLALRRKNRDDWLTRVSSIHPRRLTWDSRFLLGVSVVVAIPVLSVVGAFASARTFGLAAVVLQSLITH
ncbi:MAG TPA: serine/threonine-protein kinase [Gemmatimonadaceae bacterium]|nr:serine/threonine-protein kinase [Gemmatimonadaceae bacterium]